MSVPQSRIVVHGTPRRRVWIWVAAGAVVAAAALVGVLHSPWLSVKEIEIQGADRADVAGLVESSGVGPGAILIWVDTGAVEDAVSSDPWVREVRVSRVFPDRLVVEVLERTPLVWIEGSTSWMLVARDGAVVEVAESPADDGLLRAFLVAPDRVPGEEPDEQAWDEVVGMAAALPGDLAAESTLVLEGSELWLNVPGHRVRLGAPVDLTDKGLVLDRLLASGEIPFGAVIDLVAPRRPAVVPAQPVPGADPQVEGEGDGEAVG